MFFLDFVLTLSLEPGSVGHGSRTRSVVRCDPHCVDGPPVMVSGHWGRGGGESPYPWLKITTQHRQGSGTKGEEEVLL